MAFLTNSVLAERRLAAFKMRSQTVIYTTRSISTNRQTGVITDTQTDTTLDDPGALIGQIDQMFLTDSGGKYTMQDREFKILATEIPETPPTKGNIITYNSKDYEIAEYKLSADLNVWVIFAKEL